MKRFAQVLVIAGAALIGATGMVSAAGVGVDIGPGGVYLGVNPGHDHGRHRHDWRRDYNYVRDCRWVTQRHWSHRRHAWVVKRERVCD